MSMLKPLFVSALFSLCLANPAGAFTSVTAGPIENVVTHVQRQAAGLDFWPDETVKAMLLPDSTYLFFAPNGGGNGCPGPPDRPTKTLGTLSEPLRFGAIRCLTTVAISDSHYYEGVGSIYRDSATGMLLRFYHIEQWYGAPGPVYSKLLVAKSINNGDSWTNLGDIITPNLPFTAMNHPDEVLTGSGHVLIVGEYFYCYFLDYLESNPFDSPRMSVARAKIADVIGAAHQNTVSPWMKYYRGTWTEPGIGGLSTSLGAQQTFSGISYNTYLRTNIMLLFTENPTVLWLRTSDDGINWSEKQEVASYPAGTLTAFYLSIIGLGDNPSWVSDQRFYAYFLYAGPGSAGWDDRNNPYVRQLITLSSSEAADTTAPKSFTNSSGP